MSGSEPERRRDLSKLTPELRAALVAELKELIERAAALTPDETVVLLHILAYAGFGDGVLVVPALSSLWGGAHSFIPKAHLPAGRARAAVKILRRRGVLRDTQEGAALVDNAALRALADATI